MIAGTRRSVVDDGASFFCTFNQQLSHTVAGMQGADLLKSVLNAKAVAVAAEPETPTGYFQANSPAGRLSCSGESCRALVDCRRWHAFRAAVRIFWGEGVQCC